MGIKSCFIKQKDTLKEFFIMLRGFGLLFHRLYAYVMKENTQLQPRHEHQHWMRKATLCGTNDRPGSLSGDYKRGMEVQE